MLVFQSAALRRGTKILFQDASLTLHQGEKIGVIGHNGCGKSSLFKLLVNELETDSGSVHIPADLRVVVTQQSIPEQEVSILQFVMAGNQELSHWQHQYEQAVSEGDHDRITQAASELENLQAWSAEPQAKQLLTGLGFSVNDFARQVNTFSGGWQMRLALARALMSPSDVLLLDEPTNHLDLDAILWLENWLKAYAGTLILISHDRIFLDSTIGRIMHFQNRQLKTYQGNYSAFEHQLAEDIRLQTSQQQKVDKQKAHLNNFIRRFRAKASKAKQAQSRIKQLEKLQDVAITQIESPYRFEFISAKQTPNPIARLENVSIGYDQVLIDHINWIVQAGDRIGIIGVNGAGKTTLLKSLLGEIDILAGETWLSDKARVGYFDQHQLNQLRPEATVMEIAQAAYPDEREQELLDYLGGFGFTSDLIKSQSQHLSGGEKSRLVLSLIMRRELNLLILDEPTNHLDLATRNALTLALQSFTGALLLVSHDRHLLETSCESYLLINNGKLEPFNGTMDDYTQWVLSQKSATDDNKPKTSSKKNQRQEAAQLRQKLAPLTKQLKQLEQQQNECADMLQRIEQNLADRDYYEAERKDELQAMLISQGELTKQLDDIETKYFTLLEEIEAAQA
jgi:ATP-binding cassette subfamily F protein 3